METSPREIIDNALARSGMDLEQLAERLGKTMRTMKAIRSGEIPMAEAVRLHIRDLVELARMRRSTFEKTARTGGGKVAAGGGPRGTVREETAAESPGQSVHLISWAQAGELENWQGGEAAAVRIRGDSMEPAYRHGTVAIVHPWLQAKSGDLVIARLADGSVLFKRLQIDGESCTFISLNPVYPPITVDKSKVELLAPVGVTLREEL